MFDKTKLLIKKNINEMLKLTSYGYIDDSTNPIIICQFLDNDVIFINLLQTHVKVNWHFSYNYKEDKIINPPVQTKYNENRVNFPINCFYDAFQKQMMVFYRRGDYLSIDLEK